MFSFQLNKYEKMIQRNLKFQVSYKRKVAKMMFIVVIAFIFCRLPFTALIFYRNQLLKNQTISKTSQVQNQVNIVQLTIILQQNQHKLYCFTGKWYIQNIVVVFKVLNIHERCYKSHDLWSYKWKISESISNDCTFKMAVSSNPQK